MTAMTDKTKPTIERRINNLRAISADDSVNNFARSICAEASSFLAAIKDPASFVRKEDYDALQSELEQIHTICLNVADCPPIAESDTRTVRYVKDMAHLINRLSAQEAK